MDDATTLIELKKELEKLRDERDWKQFHTPKDVGEQIAVEAGELLELFLWKSGADVLKKMEEDAEYRNDVEEEFADVLLSCFTFANAADIDIATVVKKKLEKVKNKYPVEKSKGNATKYNRL
ncbi:nucleotide pyrophosphohydrolase [Candidatus Kaiserbacteria bacterium]|nr:MAG: nucleotide pyrophosphohydrolase [Candidatus Kaiserbacteria bacterium]